MSPKRGARSRPPFACCTQREGWTTRPSRSCCVLQERRRPRMRPRHLSRELLVLGVLALLASSCTWGDGTITDITWNQARGGQFLQGKFVDGAVHVEAGPSGGTFSLIPFG